jgi:hypothetical protein
MIYESAYWKDDLLRAADELERRLTQSRWHPATFAGVEKTVMIGFYAIRKLIEATKLDDNTTKQNISLAKYPSTGKAVTRLNWTSYWELYDLGAPKRGTLPLVQLCHQFVHSYVFICEFSELKAFTSVLVSSERERNRHLYSVSIPVIVRLFRSVGRNYPTQTTMRFNVKKGDFDVSRSVGPEGAKPRTRLLRDRSVSKRVG